MDIKSLQDSIKSIEATGEEHMAQMRVETDEMEEKIIDVIDKKF